MERAGGAGRGDRSLTFCVARTIERLGSLRRVRNLLALPGRLRQDWGMTAYISHTSVDCRDAYQLSEWWKQVLGYVDVADDPNETGDEECMIIRPDGGHRVLFIEVPEGKQGKNRLHFDLRPTEGTRDEELARLRELGATEVTDLRGKYGAGTGWVVVADPEGNEFCILRSEAEAAQAQ